MGILPSKDEITFRWLFDHIPVAWWVGIASAIISVFLGGIWVGRISSRSLDSNIASKIAVRDKLLSDIQNMSAKKAQLHAEIVRLQVEKETEKMTPQQVRQALKDNWSRD